MTLVIERFAGLIQGPLSVLPMFLGDIPWAHLDSFSKLPGKTVRGIQVDSGFKIDVNKPRHRAYVGLSVHTPVCGPSTTLSYICGYVILYSGTFYHLCNTRLLGWDN